MSSSFLPAAAAATGVALGLGAIVLSHHLRSCPRLAPEVSNKDGSCKLATGPRPAAAAAVVATADAAASDIASEQRNRDRPARGNRDDDTLESLRARSRRVRGAVDVCVLSCIAMAIAFVLARDYGFSWLDHLSEWLPRERALIMDLLRAVCRGHCG